MLRKIIGFIVLLVIFNLIILILAPGIFNDVFLLISLAVFYFYLLIEQVYKIEPPADYQPQWRDALLILMFFLFPFLFVLSFHEKQSIIPGLLPFWDTELVRYAGLFILVIGEIITFSSRLSLGRYGTTVIIVEDDHQLITSGVYGYVRHPIYLGGLLLYTGIILAFGGFLVPFVMFIVWLLLMHGRLRLEEKLLEEKFGEEYRDYKKRTKKLIPFIY